MASSGDEKKTAHQIRSQVDHSVRETFADSIKSVMWDNNVVRLEFDVHRIEGEGRIARTTAARLVLTHSAAVELFKQLQQKLGEQKEHMLAAQGPKPDDPIN